MKKVYSDATSALAGLLHDNMTIAAGGFGLCGIPENLIQALVASGAKGLTIVGNNAGVDDFGMGLLLKSHQVKKVIASYVLSLIHISEPTRLLSISYAVF